MSLESESNLEPQSKLAPYYLEVLTDDAQAFFPFTNKKRPTEEDFTKVVLPVGRYRIDKVLVDSLRVRINSHYGYLIDVAMINLQLKKCRFLNRNLEEIEWREYFIAS